MDELDPSGLARIAQATLQGILQGATPSSFAELENPEGLPISFELVQTPTPSISPAATALTA